MIAEVFKYQSKNNVMKYLSILFAAALWVVSCNTGSRADGSNEAAQEQPSAVQEPSAAEQEQPAAAAEWVEVVLDVEGMTCDGCENAIKAGVESLEGIQTVKSSHEEGWTRVKYDSNRTSQEEIEGKITETGYEVKGVKGPEGT